VAFLGPERFDVAETEVVIDVDVDVLPAGASLSSGAVAVNPVAGTSDDAAQLLDVDVQQVTRVLVLVAIQRLGGLGRTQAPHAGLTEDPADGRPWQACHLRDLASRQLLAPQVKHLDSKILWGACGRAARSARAVLKAWDALLTEAPEPLGRGPDAQPEGWTRRKAAEAFGLHPTDQ
jgi:hypothetical protein